jgi:hypothetical protein
MTAEPRGRDAEVREAMAKQDHTINVSTPEYGAVLPDGNG